MFTVGQLTVNCKVKFTPHITCSDTVSVVKPEPEVMTAVDDSDDTEQTTSQCLPGLNISKIKQIR